MDTPQKASPKDSPQQLKETIRRWGEELGFQQVGFCDTDLATAEAALHRWLGQGYHGEMEFMARHGSRRSRPDELVPGTLSIISLRMDYLPHSMAIAEGVLQQPERAYVSRYALGRDYHKLMRQRLQRLCDQIEQAYGGFGYRVFVDSAPVLEKAIAEKAGLGWVGKHSNVIHREHGSWFFLGEVYTNLPLPPDPPAEKHCGDCRACIDVCPTAAIVAPYEVDARRCISYLTIELRTAIPVEFRRAIGNRIYGCDDCQLSCPWNRFAHLSGEGDFQPRHHLDDAALIELFAWSEAEFDTRLQGSAIRRIGHACWLRNIAVALGNAPTTPALVSALQSRRNHPSELVQEHVAWALAQHDRD